MDGLRSDWSFALPGAEAAVLVSDHGLADDSDIGGQLGGGRNGNKGEEDELFSEDETMRQYKALDVNVKCSPTYQLHGWEVEVVLCF